MNRKSVGFILPALLVLAVFLFFGYTLTRAQAGQRTAESAAVGSAFTYQGRLNNDDVPANGSYDFYFYLYDAPSAGNQIGSLVEQTIVVSEGLFTTQLDFGSDVFNGEPRYLAIEVQFDGGGYYQLTPRQPLTAVPYASYADKVQPVENVVVVAKSGGDFTSVSAALASISDASATNPYLIKVAPGVYTGTATLKAYVDIEGSGAGITILRGLGGTTFNGTLHASGITPTEVRHLTVESVTSATVAIGISAQNTDESLKFTHVTVTASGGTSDSYGIYNFNASPTISDAVFSATGVANVRGIFNQTNSSPSLFNVSVMATGGTTNVGVFNYDGAAPLMTNVTGSAGAGTPSYGMANYIGSAPIIWESEFSGVTSNIFNDGSSRVSYSAENVIWVARAGGDFKSISDALASITDASALNPYIIKIAPGVYSDTIDLISYVDIEGSGEGVTTLRGFGGDIWPGDDGSSATLRVTGDIIAEVRYLTVESDGTGKERGTAIWTNGASASLKLTHITASATGGSISNSGVYNLSSSPAMSHVNISASGVSGHGVLNNNSSTPTIRDSVLMGTFRSITSINLSNAKIANTMLDNGAGLAGSNTCFNTYDSSFATYVCP